MTAPRLRAAREADFTELMTWFPRAEDVDVWGGPKFRFPFTLETFLEDCHWPGMRSYVLDDGGRLLAFGQVYERHARINLARLAVGPDHRGKGFGSLLVRRLMDESRECFSLDEFSLFVLRDNAPALNCYLACGFRIAEYPEAEMADVCYYMTRPVHSF